MKKKSQPDVQEFQEWTISRTVANPAAASGHHIQVLTKDTLAGFVIVPHMIPLKSDLIIRRGKTPGGLDHFSLNLGNAVTFTLVGRIEYSGDWEGIS